MARYVGDGCGQPLSQSMRSYTKNEDGPISWNFKCTARAISGAQLKFERMYGKPKINGHNSDHFLLSVQTFRIQSHFNLSEWVNFVEGYLLNSRFFFSRAFGAREKYGIIGAQVHP